MAEKDNYFTEERDFDKMNIICNKNTLNDAIASVSKAVSSHSNFPILEGILIKADLEGKITLVSNDMEMGIEATTEARVIKPGQAVLNAKMLGNIIKTLPSEEVYIETNEINFCTIKSGNSKFEIMGLNPLDFPELPDVCHEYSVKIDSKSLKEMISKTIFCTSLSENRPVLKGCLVEIEGKVIKMIATDGFRMAVRKYHLENEYPEKKFIVPAKTLSEITKIIKDDDSMVEINCTSKNAVFIFENCKIVTRLIEGEYIKYESALYEDGEIEFNCPLYELFDSVYRASLIINGNSNDAPIKLNIKENNINVSCETIIGKVDDNISVETGNAELEIGFFNEFLLDVLRACDDENVRVKFRKNINPMIVTPVEGDKYLYLLLPRKLK